MKKQTKTTREERKMKMAEAGIMFALVLAITVFVGVKFASHDKTIDTITQVTEQSAVSEDVSPVETIVDAEVVVVAPEITVEDPVVSEVETPRVVTRLATVGYDQLFVMKGDGVYSHDYSGAIAKDAVLEGSDVEAVRAGRVSITPVQLLASPRLDPQLRRALERNSR